jgi:transcription initiation factor TFIID subunit TAF12
VKTPGSTPQPSVQQQQQQQQQQQANNRQDGMSQQGLNGGNYPPLSTVGHNGTLFNLYICV